MQLPLMLDRRPSVILAAVLFLGFGSAITVVAVLPLHWGLRLTAIAALLFALGWELNRALLRDRGAVRSLRLLADGSLEAGFNDGRWELSNVGEASFVTRWLVIIRLQGTAGTRAVVLLPDGLAPEQHRRLRVWLRWCVKPDAVVGAQ